MCMYFLLTFLSLCKLEIILTAWDSIAVATVLYLENIETRAAFQESRLSRIRIYTSTYKHSIREASFFRTRKSYNLQLKLNYVSLLKATLQTRQYLVFWKPSSSHECFSDGPENLISSRKFLGADLVFYFATYAKTSGIRCKLYPGVRQHPPLRNFPVPRPAQ